MIAAALALAAAIEVGQLATFTRAGMRDAVCVRVSSLDLAPGGAPAAWIVYTGDSPVHALHAQLVDLRPGCDRPCRL